MYKAFLIAVAAALITAAGTATATPMSWTFTANGVTDSFSQQGTAVFTWADVNNPNSFTLTLTDNVSPTANIQSELDGLVFGFSQTPTSVTLTPSGITPTSIIDCTNGTNPCPSGTGTSPYGWGTTFSGGMVDLSAGFATGTHQPFGIVNANYDATGLSGPLNNPLLIGPVTFQFTTTGLTSIPMITGVQFDFGIGTPLNQQPGVAVIPEPAPLALLAIGLVAGWLARRRSKA
jgi:hypothetical protein